jgi:hypothetical protein
MQLIINSLYFKTWADEPIFCGDGHLDIPVINASRRSVNLRAKRR